MDSAVRHILESTYNLANFKSFHPNVTREPSTRTLENPNSGMPRPVYY